MERGLKTSSLGKVQKYKCTKRDESVSFVPSREIPKGGIFLEFVRFPGITILHRLGLTSNKFYTQPLTFVFSEIRKKTEGFRDETCSLLVSRVTRKAPRMIRCTYVG